MILSECPHCRVKHVQSKVDFTSNLNPANAYPKWNVVRCQNEECRTLVLVQSDKEGNATKVYPFSGHGLSANDAIPPEVRSDFEEASTCLSAGCYKASLVMSRRVQGVLAR